MHIFYSDTALFLSSAAVHFLPGTLVDVPGGKVIERPDGSVVSVQPTGAVDSRPHGTAGLWETCQVDPAINVLRFTGTGIPYAVVYRAG